jgi:hypothetical protein
MLLAEQRKRKQETRPSNEVGLAGIIEGGWIPPTPS